MDFNAVSAYGRSTTATAWVTNPVRRVLWWLIAPYFNGAGIEISAALAHHPANAGAGGLTADAEGAYREADALRKGFDSLRKEIDGLRKEIVELRLGNDGSRDQIKGTRKDINGIFKDINAIALRLGGIEEEAGAHAAELASGKHLHEQLTERIIEIAARADETGIRLAAFAQAQQQIAGPAGEAAPPAAAGPDAPIAIGQTGLSLVERAGGVRFLVRPQDHIGRIITDGLEWEPHVREAIELAKDPDGIAIDAGAYIGIHTVTMSRMFGKVHAFEPQHGIYQTLCGNLVLNGCANVTTYNMALYDRAGSVRLAPQARQETELFLDRGGRPDYRLIANAAALSFDFLEAGGEVPALALDDLALENIRLIKIDTQGADLRVLQGATDSLRRCRPIVLFEWEHALGEMHGATMERLSGFFTELNYDLTLLHDTSPGRQADYIAKPR